MEGETQSPQNLCFLDMHYLWDMGEVPQCFLRRKDSISIVCSKYLQLKIYKVFSVPKKQKDFLGIITLLSPLMDKKSSKRTVYMCHLSFPVVKILPPTCIKKEKIEINYLDFFCVFFLTKRIFHRHTKVCLYLAFYF